MSPLLIIPDHGHDNQSDRRPAGHRVIPRCLALPLVAVALVGTIVLGPRSSNALRSKARRLETYRTRALLHVWALLGSYQAFNIVATFTYIEALDLNGYRWVLRSDAEELRSCLFPMSPGDKPGAWQSVDVMCPTHGN